MAIPLKTKMGPPPDKPNTNRRVSLRGSLEGRGRYMVNRKTQTVYKLVSTEPIGIGEDNIPVYKVKLSVPPELYNAKTRKREPEFYAVKRVNFYDFNSIKPFSKLLRKVQRVNKKFPWDHPYLMQVHSYFIDLETESLCVVMPFADGGSLRSIMADRFPYGFSETCISVILRAVLEALRTLHSVHHYHGNINAGNIYVSNGPEIRLGFGATVYEHGVRERESSSSSPCLPAADISKWAAAPEVFDGGPDDQLSIEADMWLVGILALELAYGGLRVPDREALEMMVKEIVETERLPKRFQVKERKEEVVEGKGKKKIETTPGELELEERAFSREFEMMVAECLEWDAEDRSAAHVLMVHDFFFLHGLKLDELRTKFQNVTMQKLDKVYTTDYEINPHRHSHKKKKRGISTPDCASEKPRGISIPGPASEIVYPEGVNVYQSINDYMERFYVPVFQDNQHIPRASSDGHRNMMDEDQQAYSRVESWMDEDSPEVEPSSSSHCLKSDSLVDPDNLIAYKIMSNYPIGTDSDNIPVYRGAYSECENDPYTRTFVETEFVSVKITNTTANLEGHDNLYDEVEKRNKKLHSSHENLMTVDGSFMDDMTWEYCVVMPFPEWGSLRSIMADYFPDGLPETCISVVLRSVLRALSFLHQQNVVHREINAGHVYVTRGPKIKLGFAATIYELGKRSNIECSSSSALPETDICNWAAAPEVYDHNLYCAKADIWLVGITALELAYGGIRVPDREALQMMIKEIVETMSLPRNYPITEKPKKGDDDKKKEDKGKKKMDPAEETDSADRSFSREFEWMVAECLALNPADRPTATDLLQHAFFIGDGIDSSVLDKLFEDIVIQICKK